jgi:MscS family membrane protein
MFLWNPVNLMDGEANWFLLFLAILAVATLTTHFWRLFCEKMCTKFLSKNRYLAEAVVSSALRPVMFFVWLFTFFISLDLITDRFISESAPQVAAKLPYVVFVLLFTWFLLLLKRNITTYLLNQSKEGQTSLVPGRIYALAKLLTLVIVLVGVLLVMQVTGMNLTAFLAVSGIGGLALAFASQEIVANFFGGMMVHIVQPFNVGEHIAIAGTQIEGIVEDIGWYETRLRTKDFQPVYIPNAQFSKASVINHGRSTERKIFETFSCHIDDMTKLSELVAALQNVLAASELVDKNKPFYAYIEQIGPASIGLVLTAASCFMAEKAFFQTRDTLLIQAAQVFQMHGAKLVC